MLSRCHIAFASLFVVALFPSVSVAQGHCCKPGMMGSSNTRMQVPMQQMMLMQQMRMNTMLTQQRMREMQLITQQQQQQNLQQFLVNQQPPSLQQIAATPQQKQALQKLLTQMSQKSDTDLQTALRNSNPYVRWAATSELARRQQAGITEQ